MVKYSYNIQSHEEPLDVDGDYSRWYIQTGTTEEGGIVYTYNEAKFESYVAQSTRDAIIAKKILETAKQAKAEQLASIVVTTAAGNAFDGNDTARNNMLSALREGDASGQTQHDFWILADNTKLEPCIYAELEEAHGLAIRAKGAILA